MAKKRKEIRVFKVKLGKALVGLMFVEGGNMRIEGNKVVVEKGKVQFNFGKSVEIEDMR